MSAVARFVNKTIGPEKLVFGLWPGLKSHFPTIPAGSTGRRRVAQVLKAPQGARVPHVSVFETWASLSSVGVGNSTDDP